MSETAAFDDALGVDISMFFQSPQMSENGFMTAIATPGPGDDGKSQCIDYGRVFNAPQDIAQMPCTIDPAILQQDMSVSDPPEDDISQRLGRSAPSHASNLGGTESQPRRELQPASQFNYDNEQPLQRSKLRSLRSRIDEDKWVTMKQIIESLFLQEEKTLVEVMTIMEVEHQFKASKTAYKNHLRQWDFKKNYPKGFAIYLWSKARQRKNERGVGTTYWYRGAQVPANKYKRAGIEDSGALPIRIPKSIQSNLTIITTSASSSDGCEEHPEPKRRRLDDLRDELSSVQDDLPSLNPQSVVLHQRKSRFPKGGDADVVDGQQGSVSLEQRLDGHSFRQTSLFDELGLMPLPNLCNLADRQTNRGLHASNEMVLEALLTKLEGSDRADADSLEKKRRYTILWLRTMIFQSKSFVARKILEGICADNSFESLPPNHRLQIYKLALLVDVHENIHEPRNIENIEAKCIALLAEQNAIGFIPDPYWPTNLILAYLFRLYGLYSRELRQVTIDSMHEVIRTQFPTKEPSISSVWAAQQYTRWCLRRIELTNAGNTLKSLKGIVEKNSSEDIQNAMLETIYKRMRPTKNQEPMAPQVVDVYERSKVDEQWLKCFEGYLWDEPYSYSEDPRMRSRKEHDTGYLH